MALLSDEQRDKARGYIDSAVEFLRLIPQLPGRSDDIAVGAVRTILISARAAMMRRSHEEVVATLRALAESDADVLDVDAIAARIKAQLANPR